MCDTHFCFKLFCAKTHTETSFTAFHCSGLLLKCSALLDDVTLPLPEEISFDVHKERANRHFRCVLVARLLVEQTEMLLNNDLCKLAYHFRDLWAGNEAHLLQLHRGKVHKLLLDRIFGTGIVEDLAAHSGCAGKRIEAKI